MIATLFVIYVCHANLLCHNRPTPEEGRKGPIRLFGHSPFPCLDCDFWKFGQEGVDSLGLWMDQRVLELVSLSLAPLCASEELAALSTTSSTLHRSFFRTLLDLRREFVLRYTSINLRFTWIRNWWCPFVGAAQLGFLSEVCRSWNRVFALWSRYYNWPNPTGLTIFSRQVIRKTQVYGHEACINEYMHR